MFSCTVRLSRRWYLWKTKPMYLRFSSARFFRSSLRTRWPAKQYSPAHPSSSMPMLLSSVVSPAPDGPMTVTNSPSFTVRLMRRSSHIIPAGLLMVFSTLRSSIIRALAFIDFDLQLLNRQLIKLLDPFIHTARPPWDRLCGPPRRDHAGDQGDCPQQKNHSDHGNRINGLQAEQYRGHIVGLRQCPGNAHQYANQPSNHSLCSDFAGSPGIVQRAQRPGRIPARHRHRRSFQNANQGLNGWMADVDQGSSHLFAQSQLLQNPFGPILHGVYLAYVTQQFHQRVHGGGRMLLAQPVCGGGFLLRLGGPQQRNVGGNRLPVGLGVGSNIRARTEPGENTPGPCTAKDQTH